MAQPTMSLPVIDYAMSGWSDGANNSIDAALDYVRGWLEDGPLPIYFTDLDSAGSLPTASLYEDCIYLVKSNGDTTLAFSDGTNLINLERAHLKYEQNTATSGSPNIISAHETGKLFTNRTATAENHHTLPTAADGLHYRWGVLDADGIQINAASGQTIRLGSTVSASTGFISSTTIGSYVHLFGITSVGWFGISTGTWTFDT